MSFGEKEILLTFLEAEALPNTLPAVSGGHRQSLQLGGSSLHPPHPLQRPGHLVGRQDISKYALLE